MSDSESVDRKTIVRLHSQAVVTLSYFYIASSVMLIYDFLVTLGPEVQFIWRRRFSGATAVYVLLRYSALLNRICLLLAIQPWSKNVAMTACTLLNHSYDTLDVTCKLTSACLIILRGYGICNRQRKALLILVPLALAPPIFQLLQAISVNRIKPLSVAEHTGYCSESNASWIAIVDTRLEWIPYISDLGVECMLVCLTWHKTFSIKKELKNLKIPTVSVASFLLRDGTLYFLVAISTVVAGMIWLGSGATLLDIPVIGFYTSFVSTLRVMLLYRFILSLRAIYYTDGHECLSTASTCLHFQPNPTMDGVHRPSMSSSLMGNLGATVMDYSQHDQEWDGEVEELMFSNDPFGAGLKDSAMKP